MNVKYKYLMKNMGLLTISNFSSKILVFLLVPLYTSVLSTAEYGTYDLVVSTVSILFPVLTANILEAIMRFLMDDSYDKEEVSIIGLRFVLSSIVIFSLAYFVLHRIDLFSSLRGLEVFVLLYYISFSFNQFFIQFAKGLEKVLEMSIGGILSTIVMIITNLLFLLVLKLGLKGFFLANILSQMIPCIFYFFRLRFWCYIKRFKTNNRIRKEMLVYCLPLLTTILGWWVNSTSDKYVVAFMCGTAANGLLAVSYKIPQIINTLQSIFTQAWQISAIKEYGAESTAVFYGKTFRIVSTLMAAACAWLIILTKPLAHLLYAKEFYNAWKFVPFLLISSVLNCCSATLGPILSAKKDSKGLALSAIYGTTANVIMNIAFVYYIGIQGATIATVISSLIIYSVRKKAIGNEITIEGYTSILITWILLCIQAIVEIYTVQWWVEVAIMIVMLIINRSTIIQVFNIVKSMIHRRKCQ